MSKPYIIYTEGDGFFILQKDFPHFIGKITHKIESNVAQYPISGYNLYVSFAGTLKGRYMPADKFILEEAQHIYADMANYLLDTKIKNSEEYEKYKI
jgi:hypothetical protein